MMKKKPLTEKEMRRRLDNVLNSKSLIGTSHVVSLYAVPVPPRNTVVPVTPPPVDAIVMYMAPPAEEPREGLPWDVWPYAPPVEQQPITNSKDAFVAGFVAAIMLVGTIGTEAASKQAEAAYEAWRKANEK